MQSTNLRLKHEQNGENAEQSLPEKKFQFEKYKKKQQNKKNKKVV